jgi:F0F1-type ATP synthase membrane subunit c/vacuolar-type H+-ATPase subunit K
MDSNLPNIDARYRTLLILWAAICMSIFTLLIMVQFVPKPATGNAMLSLALNCAGVMPLGLSFLLKQRVLTQAIAEQRIDRVQTAYVVSFALCEAAALLGLADHFITGARYYYLGFVFGGLGMLLHFPQKKHLLAASTQEF